jgi:hypothetical protein
MLYSFATNDYERFDEPGNNPVWFKDNRQLLYTTRGELHIFDTLTRKSRHCSPSRRTLCKATVFHPTTARSISASSPSKPTSGSLPSTRP